MENAFTIKGKLTVNIGESYLPMQNIISILEKRNAGSLYFSMFLLSCFRLCMNFFQSK